MANLKEAVNKKFFGGRATFRSDAKKPAEDTVSAPPKKRVTK